ncbi:hypothetical protein PanWU01x14_002970 [Parasponia andersonii]|uniref:Uncharacterized protein n=1 Tax=Parasponia andersonii TaxID=3476 RepID=A0A2P5E5D3_PARAD|nr:hypothetical protein PanWU01x14_002970 [Parasponia andersonii]
MVFQLQFVRDMSINHSPLKKIRPKKQSIAWKEDSADDASTSSLGLVPARAVQGSEGTEFSRGDPTTSSSRKPPKSSSVSHRSVVELLPPEATVKHHSCWIW